MFFFFSLIRDCCNGWILVGNCLQYVIYNEIIGSDWMPNYEFMLKLTFFHSFLCEHKFLKRDIGFTCSFFGESSNFNINRVVNNFFTNIKYNLEPNDFKIKKSRIHLWRRAYNSSISILIPFPKIYSPPNHSCSGYSTKELTKVREYIPSVECI